MKVGPDVPTNTEAGSLQRAFDLGLEAGRGQERLENAGRSVRRWAIASLVGSILAVLLTLWAR